jgi:hypothetical protein
MNETVDEILTECTVGHTGPEIRDRLREAGYLIVPMSPKGYWVVPDYRGMTPAQFYSAVVSVAAQNTP